MTEILFSPRTLGFFDLLDEDDQEFVTGQRIEDCLSFLDDRERSVIELRFGLNDHHPHTLHQVAEVIGVSHTSVARDEKRAIQKIASVLK